MTDNRAVRNEPDRSKVNVEHARERRYWAHRFGVTEEELRKAVEAVGPKASFVERCLRTGS